MSTEDLVTLYCRVMHENKTTFINHPSYVVRHWDGMDGCWTDYTGEVSRETALGTWSKLTHGGTRQVSYAEIDYFRIFPGGTRMLWDGTTDHEMHR